MTKFLQILRNFTGQRRQFCGFLGEYGQKRLTAVLNTVKDKSPHEILLDVKEDIDRFVGQAPQFDDITMLCLEYTAHMSEAGEQKGRPVNHNEVQRPLCIITLK